MANIITIIHNEPDESQSVLWPDGTAGPFDDISAKNFAARARIHKVTTVVWPGSNPDDPSSSMYGDLPQGEYSVADFVKWLESIS
jgi:hypothetical protein